jgi:hypothetical protein
MKAPIPKQAWVAPAHCHFEYSSSRADYHSIWKRRDNIGLFSYDVYFLLFRRLGPKTYNLWLALRTFLSTGTIKVNSYLYLA